MDGGFFQLGELSLMMELAGDQNWEGSTADPM